MISRQGSLSSSVSNVHSHPQRIGPWKLGKTLGRGATGRVLLGVHHLTGQKAAVKVVSKSELNEEYEQPRDKKGSLPYGIEREIIIMKLLTHPNVLRLYDVWETSKALYLVLEYVEGGELFDLLVERGPLHEQEAVKYFRQIVLGTAYCHALGICHRDLKPENLLLDGALNVKLADFGMAALESNGKLLETSCGSPHYAAPEIVSGLKYHGAASDVWSCGVILFALLTGRLPFDDENIRNLLLKVQAGSFDMPPELSGDARDLIARMLTADPARRPSTADVLHHRLLAKYPVPNEDLISVRSLPHPQTAHTSLGSAKNIDPHILENLAILWNGRPQADIVAALLADGPGPEKTFYALLSRYRHTQDDGTVAASPRRLPRSASGLSRASHTPSRRRASQVPASTARHRPVSFQRRYGARTSAVSSATNSPYKSPARSPRRSPAKSSSFRASAGPLPRNIYNEIMAAAPDMPPTLPSKDSIYGAGKNSGGAGENGEHGGEIGGENDGEHGGEHGGAAGKGAGLAAAPPLVARAARRKSLRQSLTSGLKRNSITVKLLSTYAKLSNETDWEYVDKSAKRTSATFGTLCDKIFNHEAYNKDDEMLIDDEEQKAREYERLMELERRKHDAEFKARRELAKQKKRQSRRSLFSSRKLHITVTEDPAPEPAGPEPQPRPSPPARALSAGAAESADAFTAADLATIKQRSVTQPAPRRNPVLTRRPVSRLDPLWIAHENVEITRAQDALEAEYKASRKAHRESMVSVGGGTPQLAFALPEHPEEPDLSAEYMSEIRKSRLLNSQLNLSGSVKRHSIAPPKRDSRADKPPEKTLIGSVNIPKVARRSSAFSNSNKRLSLLTLKSTKESYHDLNSFLDTHNEDLDDDELAEQEQLSRAHSRGVSGSIPGLRTSFADRLDGARMPDDEPVDSASVIDFDEHLANRRSSYYAGGARNRVSMLKADRRQSAADCDYTFAEDDGRPDAHGQTVFDQIKLPEGKPPARAADKARPRVSAVKPSANTMLLPDLENVENASGGARAKPYGTLAEKNGKAPLVDSTNVAASAGTSAAAAAAAPNAGATAGAGAGAGASAGADAPQKRNRSIFRKLSWGSKKYMDDPQHQLPTPASSVDEKKGGIFTRLFSSSSHQTEVHRYATILPRHEMTTALYALLTSWTTFGLKNLKADSVGYNIMGGISSRNSFNFKSCKFRIKVSQRDMGQKSEVICTHVKGSSVTSNTLFKEIYRVLEKEGVLEG